MNLDLARQLVQQLAEALTEEPEAPPAEPLITTASEFTAALADSRRMFLRLSPTFSYDSHVVVNRPVSIYTDGIAEFGPQRMTADYQLASFNNGIDVSGNMVFLEGLQARHQAHGTDVVVVTGGGAVLDRNRILGDAQAGAKRGIQANGGGDCWIERNYIDDCFLPTSGTEAQGIGVFDMLPGLVIRDNFIRAGTQAILIGGADPTSEARIPADIQITGNTLTARPEWMTQTPAVGCKTRLEFKNAKRVLVEDNLVEYAWKQGQTGYLLTLTPRNQGNRAPWTTIEDVEVRNNTFRHGCGAISLLGSDNVNPSQRMSRITIHHNRFEDCDPTLYLNGANKLILVSRGPKDVTIDNNVFTGGHLSAVVYFDGLSAGQCENFLVTNNTWPVSTYAVFGSGAGVGLNLSGLPRAWELYVASGTLANNVIG